MSQQQLEIIEAFLQDEELALVRQEQGPYYPQNHHRIKPLIPRAIKLLPPELLTRFFFHLLRLNVCPAIKTDLELAALCSAYRQVVELLAAGHPRCSLPRPKGLFLFGYDDLGPLALESETGLAAYLAHLKFWCYADSFWHMPGMLKKSQSFLPLSADRGRIERVLEVLRRVDLQRDLPIRTTLWYWAMVLLVIQQREQGSALLHHLAVIDCPPSTWVFFRGNVSRYLEVAPHPELLHEWDALTASRP